jgi:nucleotide-binding universal stress UspA family protein
MRDRRFEAGRKGDCLCGQAGEEERCFAHIPERRTYFWDQDILDASAAQVHKIMRAAMSAANKAKLSGATCVTVSGRDIAGAISAYAKKNGVDQIIMGSHGRRGAARLLLGSVAGSVAARASCPVTIVP